MARAAVKKPANLAALKLKGWLDADTGAFENARGKLGDTDQTQEDAKGGAKGATGSRNHVANELYDHLLTIQNAADLQWPAEDQANGPVRDEFRLDTFPPRGGGNAGAASSTTPAPARTLSSQCKCRRTRKTTNTSLMSERMLTEYWKIR